MKTAVTLLFFCPLLQLASFGQAAFQHDAADPVAVVAGQLISEQELLEALGPQLMQLHNQEYQAKSKVLENLIRLRLVQAEAKKRGIPAEQLIQQEVDSKIADSPDTEVEAYFWGQNREGIRFEDVKEKYRASLKELRIRKARQAYADSLRTQTEVAVLLRPPSVDVAFDTTRVKGDPKASVTVVEFSDFQCPFCKKSEAVLKDLLTKYQGQVRLAYLDFPLFEIHSHAEKAAEAARCAGEQGKFWEYHDSLFADQSKLDEASLVQRAHALQLDENAFHSCLSSGRFKANIEADWAEGNKLGVDGTPAYFINGVFLSGAQPQVEFERIIDNELSARANPQSSSQPAARAPKGF